MLKDLKEATNVAYTENGAQAYATTGSALLDFFGQGGALRNRDEKDIVSMWIAAFCEDRLLATKMFFYFRDVRGGQGERRTFRTILRYLGNRYPDIVQKNIELVPYYGRWDDLYCLFGTKASCYAIELIRKQFATDMKEEQPSLLGKWLASENTSSAATRELGAKTRNALGLSPRQYRKALTSLRKKINIVERMMSKNEWDQIAYDKLPSKAGLQYRGAFLRHDSHRYIKFIEAVKSGKAKINAGTLYPYELVEKVLGSYPGADDEDTLNVLWDNLPDYYEGNNENALVVADVSGSMAGRPIGVSISLAMYVAEKNTGPYHNHFLTFSSRPVLQSIVGNTFCEKVRNLSRSDWDNNTDIEAVFNLLLDIAVKHQYSPDDMVQKIYIVSDMEFDESCTSTDVALFEAIRQKYLQAGYQMPLLVFWNVDARNKQFAMDEQRGILFVSGASPSIFSNLLKGRFVSPYDLMLDTLAADRYNLVTI